MGDRRSARELKPAPQELVVRDGGLTDRQDVHLSVESGPDRHKPTFVEAAPEHREGRRIHLSPSTAHPDSAGLPNRRATS
jgi:hypothetical protein